MRKCLTYFSLSIIYQIFLEIAQNLMKQEDLQEWAEAYDKEHQDFIEQGTLKTGCSENGARVLDSGYNHSNPFQGDQLC
jgi:hypothetical protein